MSAAPVLSHHSTLDRDQVSHVLALLEAVSDADGVSPVSEHVLLHLRHGGDRDADNILLRTPEGDLAGYAHLDDTDLVDGASAELAVHPDQRGHGYGGLLVERAQELSHDGRLRLWAHGRQPGAQALAARYGYSTSRVLWQMRKSLLSRLPEVSMPAGTHLRSFVVGRDEAEWTDVNNRAFAKHPDQGRWSIEEIRTREKEPWFDPDGFLLAVDDESDAIIGFHWTKVHGGQALAGLHPQADSDTGHRHDHEPIGEVYVVGVDPDAQGRGLGPALTLAGLRYLRSRGLTHVMLYVDESNANAIRVYERLGFTRWDVDVSYRRTPSFT